MWEINIMEAEAKTIAVVEVLNFYHVVWSTGHTQHVCWNEFVHGFGIDKGEKGDISDESYISRAISNVIKLEKTKGETE